MTDALFDSEPDDWHPARLRRDVERALDTGHDLLLTGRLGAGRKRTALLAERLLALRGEGVVIRSAPDGTPPVTDAERLIVLGDPRTRGPDVSRGRPIDHVFVAPWSADEVRALVGEACPPGLADELHRVTGGHLGFLRCWADAGSPVRLDDTGIWLGFVERALDVLSGPARRLAEELACGFRVLGDPGAPALADATVDPEPLVNELDRVALLTSQGELVAAAAAAIRSRLPSYRRHLLQRSVLKSLQDPCGHADLLDELARDGVRDARLAEHLVRLGEWARLEDPGRARHWFEAATQAGASGPDALAGLAETALWTGDLTHALRDAEAALTGPPGPARERALRVAQQAWLGKGQPARAADVNERYAANASMLEATVSFLTRLRAGDLAAADAAWSRADDRDRTTLDEHACLRLVQTLRRLVAGDAAEATAIDHLCELGIDISPAYRLATSWVTVVAPTALAAGRTVAARRMLDSLPASEHTGEVALLLGWARLGLGDVAGARAALSEAGDPALVPRTDLLARGLAVAVAQHTNDRDALAEAWPGLVAAVNRCEPDLFGLVVHPELLIASARLRDRAAVRGACTRASSLLERLGHPPVWANLIDWASIQAAILTDAPLEVKDPAQRLRRASDTSAQARALAHAGKVWIEVLARRADAREVVGAIQGLAGIGNAADGARLASHAAARCDDPAVRRDLMDLARQYTPGAGPGAARAGSSSTGGLQLSEREIEVARLVVQHLSYREIGERLYLSPRTVENHVARIKRRAGVESRRALLDLLVQAVHDADRSD